MVRVIFAPAIQRHVGVDEQRVPATTLGEALRAVFAL